jgi:glucokinase
MPEEGLVPKALAWIGVDVGGSKIAAVVLGTGGVLREPAIVATQAADGPQGVIERIVEVVGRLARWAMAEGLEIGGLGVATTGIVDVSAGVLTSVTRALPGFDGVRLRDRLEELVGWQVVVLNDVHAMAIAEQGLGAGQGVGDVLYVSVGTGVGGAVTREGRLMLGAHGSAGDLGHIMVDGAPTAPVCPCGRRGHLEALVSGPGLVREYRRRSGSGCDDGGLSLVAARARAGDTVASDVLLWGGDCLGRAVGGVVNFSDPALVVFGGGLLGLGDDLFWNRVRASLLAEVRRPQPPQLGYASFENDAAAVGAALAARGAVAGLAPWAPR